MNQRLQYALAQGLLVIGCTVLIPAGTIVILKLSGERAPEMFGWYGMLLLVLIYAPLSALVSAFALAINTFLEGTPAKGQTIMAVLIGNLHGIVLVCACALNSLPILWIGAAVVSVYVVVSCVAHRYRDRNRKKQDITNRLKEG